MSTDQPYSEKELFLRIAEGDEQAFGLFFKQFSPLLQQWIRRLIRDETGSMEVLQDVFVQIWLYRDKLTEVNSLIPWLKTVATHQCFKHLSRQKAYYARTGSDVSLSFPVPLSGGEDHLNYKELQADIYKALTELTPQQRQIYLLSREEGLKSDEIARQLNLSRGHVRNTISDILGRLRSHLKQSGRIFFIGWLIFLK